MSDLQHNLIAILSADVKDYTRHMQRDESGTIQRLSDCRKIFADEINKHSGRIADTAGDSILAEFASIRHAVICAVYVQEKLDLYNEPLDDEEKFFFRIGINMGDVVRRGEAIIGDVINVAARVESVAEPGGVCLSGSVYDVVKHKLPYRYEYLGEKILKNVAEPVRIYKVVFEQIANSNVTQVVTSKNRLIELLSESSHTTKAAIAILIVVAVIFLLFSYKTENRETSAGVVNNSESSATGRTSNSGQSVAAQQPVTDRSIAVLPFADLSENGDQSWYSDGLTVEIINSLSQLPELHIKGRTSSFQFKGKDIDIREIAKVLNVANICEGSVRRYDDKLLITAQLSRANDGFNLWSETYEATTAHLFDVQRDIAEKIASAMDLVLDNNQRERMFQSGTRNVEAFEAYLKGVVIMDAYHSGIKDKSLWDANVYFEQAMKLDPGYAEAALRHMDAFAHLLMDGQSGDSNYTQEQALSLLLKDLDFAIKNSINPTVRLEAEINREFFSPTWYRLPGLIEGLRRELPEHGIFSTPVGWLPDILGVTGDVDLSRMIYTKYLVDDPLDALAWHEMIYLEIYAGNFDKVKSLLTDARKTVGDSSLLRNVELVAAILQGNRERVIKLLTDSFQGDTIRRAYLAAVKGDYDTAVRDLANQDTRDDFPNEKLLEVYYEIGSEELTRELVQRIDRLPAGPAILLRYVSSLGNALDFNLEDTPNFSRKLDQAGINKEKFTRLPRFSIQADQANRERINE